MRWSPVLQEHDRSLYPLLSGCEATTAPLTLVRTERPDRNQI